MPVTNLPYIQREMLRYGYSIYLVFGVIGNIFNCIMFTRRAYRRIPSSLYLLSLSIFSMMFLLWTLSISIYTSYYTDPQLTSVPYCKMRFYTSHVLNLYLRYSVVLACVDRYFITRTNVRLRSLSSVKTAMKFLLIMLLVFPLIAMHMPISMDLINNVCGMFGSYKLFYAIYQLIILSISPPVLMSIFSILAIRSLHQRHHALQPRASQSDRYMTRMVIAEVVVNVVTSIPYSANLLYGAATFFVLDKSALRLEIESFITFVITLTIYFVGVTPFYLFILTSKPFRQEFIHFFANVCHKYITRRIRIAPLHDQVTNATNRVPVTMANNKSRHHIP